MMKYFFILIVVYFMYSCGSNSRQNGSNHLELLQAELCLDLPNDISVVKNEYHSFNQFESDYQITVEIVVNKGLNEIIETIQNTPFYDSLTKYRNTGSGVVIEEEESDYYNSIKDTFSRSSCRGTWSKINDNYEFIDFGDKLRSVKATVNPKTKIIYFEYNSL